VLCPRTSPELRQRRLVGDEPNLPLWHDGFSAKAEDDYPEEHARRSIVAKAGEVIYNPVQNDRIVYRKTAQDTDGELLSLDLFVSPRGGNPLHVHPLQEEYFKAVSGTLGVQVGDEHRVLGEGEEATVPPGTPHRWWNDSDEEEAHVLVELRPALDTETFFETAYGLARDGKTDENGAYNLLQQAVTLNGINRGEIYLARPPVAVQQALLAAIAPVGRLLGYKDHYPRYSAEDGEGEAGPPSRASVMARGAVLAGGLVAASWFLVGKMKRRRRD
jgi:quercetin dioxygenase-like cupin family protein